MLNAGHSVIFGLRRSVMRWRLFFAPHPSGALAAGTIASPWSTAAGAPDTNGSGGADAKHLDVGDASDDEKDMSAADAREYGVQTSNRASRRRWRYTRRAAAARSSYPTRARCTVSPDMLEELAGYVERCRLWSGRVRFPGCILVGKLLNSD
ncbi:uncharacterized protein LOC119190217 [Manduca sexta]|uniref:uncharacterized protein LOC119190217 n=1 Tax=Manduca sexta TaxID=7130 RepID=UPI00188FAAEB|nr:uncharacterized protein LOC119190217 [Manduca sexta]